MLDAKALDYVGTAEIVGGSMKQLEAYREDAIKRILSDAAVVEKDYVVEVVIQRLILAYAVAKAEAERLEFWRLDKDYNDRRWDWTDAEWLQAVLTRIGWPEDGEQGEKNDD